MGTRKQRSALRVVGTLDVAQQFSGSTSVDVGGAVILDVNTLSTTQTVTAAGGMLNVGGASQTFTLPTSTAGTVYDIFFSSGATNVIVATSTTGTKFWGLPSTDTATLSNFIVGSTGDHCRIVALSSSQWNIMSYSSNLTSSS